MMNGTTRTGLLALWAATAALIAACSGSKVANHAGAGASGVGAGGQSPVAGSSTAGVGGGGTGAGAGGAVVYPPLPLPPATPELWYWHSSYLSGTSTIEPAHSEALIDQAVAAGYTGLALWDSSVTFLTLPDWDPSKLQTVVAYAVEKGLEVLPGAAPFGYSNDLLHFDPNQAEGQHVTGSRFTVTGGQLVPVNSLPPVGNPGFESGMTVWFSFGDPGLSVDDSTAHTGSASALFAPVASTNQRLTTPLTVTPWRLYHVGFWAKTSGYGGGDFMIAGLDTTTDPPNTLDRVNRDLTMPSDSDWTRYDTTFNSRESTQLLLYIGIWGGHTGDRWIDDIIVEETSLVNLLRRDGTPVKVYDPTTMTTYDEGTDVAMVVDPTLVANGENYDAYHTPPVITVPAGSALTPGQTIAIDYYSVFPAIAGGVGACLTEPFIQTWMHQNLAAIAGIFPQGSGFFLSYDEMRHMNSCELCRSKNLTAGQLLAWSVGQSVGEVNVVRPGAQLYVWSDMFDIYQNAVDNYYSVEGTLVGSWQGLPPGMIMMNWNLGSLQKSLPWFAGKDPSGMQPHGFQQIIAGFYDDPAGGASTSASEMAAAMGVPGVIGAMYTTWTPDYSQLQQYADGIRGAWSAYRKSVGGP
jgi:hypothetical protein